MLSNDLPELLESWLLSLRAQRKSEQTITSYALGVRAYLKWCSETGTAPELSRAQLDGFTAHVLQRGAAPATARTRHVAVRQFSAWLAAEGETGSDELSGARAPKLDVTVRAVPDADQLAALLKACAGSGFHDRRDAAIVRLMIETGIRAGEVVAMRTDDVDLKRQVATIRRGKGGKGRIVPLSAKTSQAIDRYLRARKSHRLAGEPALWLGVGGKTLGYPGLYRTLQRRAEAAGIREFSPHALRHAAAGRWLARGGSEGGLMSVAGWSSRQMLDRYSAASASDRAIAEARNLGLDDL